MITMTMTNSRRRPQTGHLRAFGVLEFVVPFVERVDWPFRDYCYSPCELFVVSLCFPFAMFPSFVVVARLLSGAWRIELLP